MWILTILLALALLAAIVFIVMMANLYNKNLNYYMLLSKNVSSMSAVEKMFAIMGKNTSAEEKIVLANKVMLELYSPKYSTLSIYDGNTYTAKATNVEKTYIESVANVAEEVDFKANASKNVSKYLTTTANKTLTYKSAMERKIKSAMFSPIYYNNTYLGFWLLEDTREGAFDNIPKEEIQKLKNNLGIFLENIAFQNTIEIAENTDKQTTFYNNMYLYSNIRQKLIDKDTSALTLICLDNLPEINEKYNRNLGNALLIKAANALKEIVGNDSFLVRYSGLRFLVVTPDCNAGVVQPMMDRYLTKLKNEVEYVSDEPVNLNAQVVIHTFRKQNNIEVEIRKMVKHIDNMKQTNIIQII